MRSFDLVRQGRQIAGRCSRFLSSLGAVALGMFAVILLSATSARADTTGADGISLGSLDGPDGYRLTGAAEGNQTGKSVQSAGDVNGDGLDDVVLGAANADPGGRESAGVAYLVFGRTDNPTGVALGAADPSRVVRLIGGLTGDHAGESVSGAGDLNGDGYGDVVIGSPGSDRGEKLDTGAAYVVFGGPALPGSISLSGLNGSNGFSLITSVEGQRFGGSVAGGGDINADGYDDLIIGAPEATLAGKEAAGQVYVVLGGPSFEAAVNVDLLDGKTGFKVSGAAEFAYLGNAVADAGDINRDGYDDLLAAAWKTSRGGINEVGAVYALYGQQTFPASLTVSAIKGGVGFRMEGATEGEHAGRAVGGRGDVNGDGFADMVIGAPFAGNSDGLAYVVFGKSDHADVVNLGALNGADGFRLAGSDDNGQAGTAVSNAADVNGDALDDILIGAPGAGAESLRFGGEAYVIFGKASFGPTLSLGALGGGVGLQYDGVSGGNQAGQAAAGAGDINGDGYDDLLIGEPKGGTLAGADLGFAYLVYGGSTMGITLPTTHPGTPNNDTLTGSAGNDVMVAGRGADSADGQSGNDSLKGGAGQDSLTGRAGADRIRGGAGRDTASYAGSPGGVTVNLQTGVGSGGDATGDMIREIEDLIGSGENDTLIGDTKANRIAPGTGSDTGTGGPGDDSFLFSPGGGQDTLTDFEAGPSTDDRLDFSGFPAVDSVGDLAVSQQGPDARIGLPDGGVIFLKGVQASALHPDDYRFGSAPIARRDRYATPAGATLQVTAPGVLRNDETVPGLPMTAVLVEPPDHGTLSLKPDGSFTYVPAPGYIGKDRFRYKANNGADSNVAAVILTVSQTPPIAHADRYTISSAGTLTVPAPGVLGNDVSPGGSPLTAVLVSGTIYGQLTLNANGSFTYKPQVDGSVTDSFTYQAVNTLTSAEATVTIEVIEGSGDFDNRARLPMILRP